MSIGRREFLAGMGGLGAGLGLGAVSHWLPLSSPRVGPDWSPGVERTVPSTCLLCPAHCGIRGRLVDGSLVAIQGNPLHPVNQGGLCPKGVAGIQLLYHPGRLTTPVERTGPPGSNQFRPVSWPDALGRVSRELGRLRDEGKAQSVAWLVGDISGVMDELVARFARVYGGSPVLRETYDDGAAEVLRLSQGIASPPAFDLAAADFVLSFGAPLSEAWWNPPQAARARGAEGARPRWVQADVRLSRTAARADEWLPVRPGTYGALALGIAYILVKEGFYDAERTRALVDGFEDWRDDSGSVVGGYRGFILRHGRTEEISRRTGLPAESIVRIAKAFGGAVRPVAVWDHCVSWREGGLSDALAIHALNILVGALNRPGGVLIQPPLPVPSIADDGAAPTSPPHSTGDLTAGNWVERITTGAGPALEALFLYYSNPVASAPDPALVARALERIPLVVSFSPFLDETARHADLVLPDHTYLERWQDATAPGSVPIAVWGVVQPMIPPLHDTRATGDVLLAVASELGPEIAGKLPWTSVEEIVRERGKALASVHQGSLMAPEFRRRELRELEARGWWLPHRKSPEEFWKSVRDVGGWFDPFYDYNDRSATSQLPEGRIWMFPEEARRSIAQSGAGLVEGFLPLERRPVEEGHDAEYPLKLMPYRVMTLASGTTPLTPWLLEHLGVLTGDAWESWAEISPETAHELGLSSGQLVRIESAAGGFTARLRSYEGVQPGMVNVPYGLHSTVEGWGRTTVANPLLAVGGGRDPATGLPDWYSTRVRVTPV